MKTEHQTVHVISILWGNQYTEKDVNNLFSMICRNTSLPIQFHLFSNETLNELNPSILKHPEPGLNVEPRFKPFNYRKEAGLCRDGLAGLDGQRVFFFDLDVLIMDNLDDLFTYPKGNAFYIINDWNTRGSHVGQASCYSFVVGTLGFIKTEFEADPASVLKTFGTASQEYLSAKAIEQFGPLNFWPEEWFQSFRYHCLPWGPLRHFVTAHRPRSGTKVLAFHGHPGLHDAIKGQWSEPHAFKAAKGWKKLYKTCRPTHWVAELWH